MKNRLTITLSDSTLQKIDQLIDKKTIRNRSHAIEHVIEQSLQPRVSTAAILAGGSKNEDDFRPLTQLNGKPLIMYTLELLKQHHITTVLIATTAKQGPDLQTLLGNGSELGLTIKYSFESKPLGTAGALANLGGMLPKQPFFVIAGDVLTTIDLQAMARFHNEYQAIATVAVKPRPTQKTYDNVFVEGHTVVDFKASSEDQIVSIVNTGVYLFEPSILSLIPATIPATLEQDVFPTLAKSNKMIAFPFQGVWFDISSDANYQEALQRM